MTDTPDKSKIAVLSKGTEKASIVVIPTGGQTNPMSGVGAKDEWKKAQKNLKKNKTSLTINNSIPVFIPLTTGTLCHPWYVDSRETSRHHIIAIRDINPTVKKKGIYDFLLIILIKAIGIDIIVKPDNKGQGEYSTK